MSISNFFPGGRERWEASAQYCELCARVEGEVRARYAPRLARAGPLRRALLLVQMERELHRELAKLSPADACFFGE